MPAVLLFPAQESDYHDDESMVSQVVFNLGMPVPFIGTNKVTKSSTMTPAPKSVSGTTDPGILKESIKLLPPSESSPPNISILTVNNADTSSLSPSVSDNSECAQDDISVSQDNSKKSIRLAVDTDALRAERKESSVQENDISCLAETLAETSLPWRRETSLPSVPSSITSSLPDDENPLMSEAPSWADNLAYSHLTETGSPYTSPQNTITCKPKVAFHRPVFELFPSGSPQCSNIDASAIPPPWSCKDNSANNQSDEPLPSYSVAGSDVGDKASCLLMSSHDRAPPSYHSCLQSAIIGFDASSSRRHSDVGSPIHFQLMHKPEMVSAAAIESQLIGIEEDYYHGMADRVSHWLANSNTGDSCCDDINCELSAREDAQRIIESLRHKQKWIMDDTDDGTDADVESDCEINDTKL